MRCFQLWKRLQSNWKLSESGISGTILDLEMLLPYNHYSMQNIVIHIITQNDTICAGGIAYLFYSGEITKAVTHEKVVNYLESHTSTLNSIYIPIVVSASQSKSQGHFTFFVFWHWLFMQPKGPGGIYSVVHTNCWILLFILWNTIAWTTLTYLDVEVMDPFNFVLVICLLNIYMYATNCFSFAGFLSFWFFSGDLSDFIPHDAISAYVASYVPALNFYLIPVIVRWQARLLIVLCIKAPVYCYY